MSVAVLAVLGGIAAVVQLAESQKVVPAALAWATPLGAALYPWLGPTVFWVVFLVCAVILLYDGIAAMVERRLSFAPSAPLAPSPQPSNPPQDTAPPPTLANPDSWERMREIVPKCRDAVEYAFKYLRETQFREIFEGEDKKLILVGTALGKYFVEEAREKIDAWQKDFYSKPKGQTKDELLAIVWRFRDALGTYCQITDWIVRLAWHLDGDGYKATPHYVELYRLHEQMLVELERIGPRTDVGQVADLLRNLRQMPASTPAAPPVSTKIEVDFGSETELSFAALLPTVDVDGVRNGTMLTAYISHIRLINNDDQQTKIVRLSLQVPGAVETEQKEAQIEGIEERTIAGRDDKTFSMRYSAVLDGQHEGATTVDLVATMAGLGEFRWPLPSWMFVRQDQRS